MKVYKLFPLKPKSKANFVQAAFISFSTQDPNEPSKSSFPPQERGGPCNLEKCKTLQNLQKHFLVKKCADSRNHSFVTFCVMSHIKSLQFVPKGEREENGGTPLAWQVTQLSAVFSVLNKCTLHSCSSS